MNLLNLKTQSEKYILSRMVIVLIIIYVFMAGGKMNAQGFIKSDYITPSTLTNAQGNKIGDGGLLKLSGAFSLPFYQKINESGQPTMWLASMHGAYGIMNHYDMSDEFIPERILNTSLNFTHLRPISKKWSLLATLGAGVYASPDDITGKSILVNGGVVFICKIRNNLSLGAGLGLTNSYGIPIGMPMLYVDWRLNGRYEIMVNMTNAMEVSVAKQLTKKIRLKLMAIEMDGISSVMDVSGESMIYASANMRSYISAEFKISKNSAFYIGGGGTWVRSSVVTKRTIKAFAQNFFKDENDKDPEYGVAGYLTTGFRFGF